MSKDTKIADWLLNILRCPNSGESLELAAEELVDELESRRKAAGLTNSLGVPSDLHFDAGLVNRSQTFFYPILNSIPTLVPGEAISLRES